MYQKIKQISSPFFRSCCLVTFKKSRGHLPLVTSGYYQDGRSLVSSFSRSSKMAAMSNSRPGLGQRLNVKIPTQGKACSVNFLWVARPPPPPPPPWGLTLIGALIYMYFNTQHLIRRSVHPLPHLSLTFTLAQQILLGC